MVKPDVLGGDSCPVPAVLCECIGTVTAIGIAICGWATCKAWIPGKEYEPRLDIQGRAQKHPCQYLIHYQISGTGETVNQVMRTLPGVGTYLFAAIIIVIEVKNPEI
jgi:hypothetical protein